MGERLIVQFAKGASRQREDHGYQQRVPPRPRRTVHRMSITGLPFETSWQDLKDFARQSGMDVVYSEVGRERDPSGGGKGYALLHHHPLACKTNTSLALLSTRLPPILQALLRSWTTASLKARLSAASLM